MPPRKATAVRTKKHARPAADDIYEGLIAEATSGTDFDSVEERPLKRRKAGPSQRPGPADKEPAVASSAVQPEIISIADDTAHSLSAEASDDELAFEDVNIAGDTVDDLESEDELDDVKVNLDEQVGNPGSAVSSRRRTGARVEKDRRIYLHKMHYMCFMTHCMYVNGWCNNKDAQKILRTRLTPTVRKYLRPNKEHTQFQQDRTFTMGLEQAVSVFKDNFEVTRNGVKRANWLPEGEEPVLDKHAELFGLQAFVKAAHTMRGSQDTGNQLFCAMLRAVGVKARIVCSFQVLPLANTVVSSATPSKPEKQIVLAIAPDVPLDSPRESTTVRERIASRMRSQLSRPAFRPVSNVRTIKKKVQLEKLVYPVFWVEVLNTAYQKWIPVDPVVTGFIGKPSKLEPPAAYPLNQLAYAIAFSKDGSAKDVTRRYARSFNAKTRRLRLESVGEAEWLQNKMRLFQRRNQTSYDEIEETELTSRLNRERLPNNIQDFKGHPVYALERHLRRNEVIHPRRESGKVNAGTAAAPKMEPIFRRVDVHICRSADQWFRLGRELKTGEQAVKLVPGRSRPDNSDEEDEPEATALYMLSQTELYIPAPVVRGRVPRNNFGNLDVYVPSMIPKGGAHVRHPLAKLAAEILEIDAVDAVTGFKFTGRKGTAVVTGVVIAERYLAAVEAVIEGLLWQEVDERSQARSVLAMRLWKRFLQVLRIAERVQSYATEPMEPMSEAEEPLINSTAWYADDDVPLHTAGLYYLDDLVELAKRAKKAKPMKARRRALSDSTENESLADDRMEISRQASIDDRAGGFLSADDAGDLNDGAAGIGGGFVVDDADGGGFIRDDADNGGSLSIDAGGEGGSVQGGGFEVEAEQDEAVDLTLDTPPITISTSDSEGQARIQRTRGSMLGAAQKPITGLGKTVLSADEESLLSHDPEDEDAEPDWADSD